MPIIINQCLGRTDPGGYLLHGACGRGVREQAALLLGPRGHRPLQQGLRLVLPRRHVHGRS